MKRVYYSDTIIIYDPNIVRRMEYIHTLRAEEMQNKRRVLYKKLCNDVRKQLNINKLIWIGIKSDAITAFIFDVEANDINRYFLKQDEKGHYIEIE
jgi:hypothetical protein